VPLQRPEAGNHVGDRDAASVTQSSHQVSDDNRESRYGPSKVKNGYPQDLLEAKIAALALR
jgi:hypothetical protein